MLLQARLINERINAANGLLVELGISAAEFSTHGDVALSPDIHSYSYHYKGELLFKLTYEESVSGYIATFAA